MENCELVMTVEEMQDREKWLLARNSGIGGSEISAVLDRNPYGNDPLSVWKRKVNPTVTEEKPDNVYMEMGRRLEPTLADYFNDHYCKVRKCGLMRRTDKPWMLASVDRLLVGKEEGLEIKTTSVRNRDEWPEGGLPEHYYYQGQWYMAVTGYKKWWYICMIDNIPIVREVPRNDEDIAVMEAEAERFWNEYVVPKKMPPVTASKACTEALIAMYPGKFEESGKNVLQLDGRFYIMIEDIKKTEEQITALKKSVDLMKNEIRAELGDMCFGHAGVWNVSYKPSQRWDVDSKKLKERYPNIYEECKKITFSRTMRITKTKDKERLGEEE